MRLTSFFHPQDLMRKPGFDDYNSGFPRLQIICQNLTESDNSNPVLYSNETLSRKLFLPGVFVFPEEKPPYIARLLYETVTGLFSFLQALQNHHEKGGLFDGKRNDRNRRRALLRRPSNKLQRLFLLEEPESRMLSQERELLLPGRVSKKELTLQWLLLCSLRQLLHEEVHE